MKKSRTGKFKFIKKCLVSLLLTPVLFTSVPASAPTQSEVLAQQAQEMKLEAKELDKRARILQAYLGQFDSPVENHAQDFIDAADQHGVDWKLVPSIAGVESTFCKQVPGGIGYNSYNCWGWGVYGTQAIFFKSWREGIFAVTEGLKKNYIDKGLTNPYIMNRIYAASPFWGGKVDYFMKDLQRFSEDFEQSSPENEDLSGLPIVKHTNIEIKTAGVSAQLAFKY